MDPLEVQSMRKRTLMVVTLVAVGIALGSVFLYVTSLNETLPWLRLTKDILILDFVNGKVILDAEERELLKEKVINTTLEDVQIKVLTADKNFTLYVTLTKSIQDIEETPVNGSRRIVIKFDYIAVVTVIFEDGSGYKIPVNWEEWTVGEPEYYAQISPPFNESIIRIGPLETRER